MKKLVMYISNVEELNDKFSAILNTFEGSIKSTWSNGTSMLVNFDDLIIRMYSDYNFTDVALRFADAFYTASSNMDRFEGRLNPDIIMLYTFESVIGYIKHNSKKSYEYFAFNYDKDAINLYKEWTSRLTKATYGLGIFPTSHSIKDVIFNDPATIILWTDGTKTVVKCQDGETFDPEKGMAMAIVKKLFGTNDSKSNFNDIFKKWIK